MLNGEVKIFVPKSVLNDEMPNLEQKFLEKWKINKYLLLILICINHNLSKLHQNDVLNVKKHII